MITIVTLINIFFNKWLVVLTNLANKGFNDESWKGSNGKESWCWVHRPCFFSLPFFLEWFPTGSGQNQKQFQMSSSCSINILWLGFHHYFSLKVCFKLSCKVVLMYCLVLFVRFIQFDTWILISVVFTFNVRDVWDHTCSALTTNHSRLFICCSSLWRWHWGGWVWSPVQITDSYSAWSSLL